RDDQERLRDDLYQRRQGVLRDDPGVLRLHERVHEERLHLLRDDERHPGLLLLSQWVVSPKARGRPSPGFVLVPFPRPPARPMLISLETPNESAHDTERSHGGSDVDAAADGPDS